MIKQLRRKRREKQLEKLLENLRIMMQNYPDGKITDIVGANAVYDLMNRAVVLAKKVGYTDDQIRDKLEGCRTCKTPPPTTVPTVDPAKAAELIQMLSRGTRENIKLEGKEETNDV